MANLQSLTSYCAQLDNLLDRFEIDKKLPTDQIIVILENKVKMNANERAKSALEKAIRFIKAYNDLVEVMSKID